ncbi:unnamed protein product [Strongylus vulgaris]|uniref:GTP cyclohydrolase 1 feedback regulatory protein n=1 Tax=Strongylus vulgaris TaxID=40348 RepID=A0A3P7LEC8_STRVU|nr:unnamed protein product [Strongylus vulgaris]
MPYLLVTTHTPIEAGPTYVGDYDSDVDLIELLQAEPSHPFGVVGYSVYCSSFAPQIVLNILEKDGWKIVGTAGTSQACIWTLHR